MKILIELAPIVRASIMTAALGSAACNIQVAVGPASSTGGSGGSSSGSSTGWGGGTTVTGDTGGSGTGGSGAGAGGSGGANIDTGACQASSEIHKYPVYQLRLVDIGADVAGNFVLTGATDGPLDLGTGQALDPNGGFFIARLDAAGHPLSLAPFGKTSETSLNLTSTIDSAGSLLLAGEAAGLEVGGVPLDDGSLGLFVVKLGPDDSHQWSYTHPYGATWALVSSPLQVANDPTGGVVIAGAFYGVIDFGTDELVSGGARCFVLKLDAAGIPLWGRAIGDSGTCYANMLAGDAAGHVLLGGDVYAGALTVGSASFANPSGPVAFVVELDADGEPVWVRADESGDIEVTGGLATPEGTSLVMFNHAANAHDFDGNLLPPDPGMVVSTLDAGGQTLWSRAIAHASGSHALRSATGDWWLTGRYFGPVDFGNGPIWGGGYGGGFVLRLDAAGNTLCAYADSVEAQGDWRLIAINASGDVLQTATTYSTPTSISVVTTSLPH